MAYIDETLPLDSKLAQAVLFVRAAIRRELSDGSAATADLALLFGLTEPEGRELGLGRALEGGDPVVRAAEIIAAARGATDRAVALVGQRHDAAELCRAWLLKRHHAAPEFASRIVALDLMTLLALEQARAWVGSGLPLLIEGRTGSGKELVARAVHDRAFRTGDVQKDVYEVVQVAGLPSEHISDELFGHVRGAFTGANEQRVGRIEAADGGTLLIDEVGDLPPDAQLRLLRVLQERKFSRLGETGLRHVNIQLVAATQHDLVARVAEGKFREDLLQRLRGWNLRLPGLRERYQQFDELIAELVGRLGGNQSRPTTVSALEALRGYTWPGNLRELEMKLKGALHSSRKRTIRIDDLSLDIQRAYLAQPLQIRALGLIGDETDDNPLTLENVRARVRQVENELARQPKVEQAGISHVELQMLEGMPDDSAEHEAKKAALRELHKATAALEEARNRVAFWSGLYARTASHPTIRTALGEACELAKKHLQSVEERASNARDRNKEVSSGWSRLFEELATSPVFERANGAHVMPIANALRLGAGMLQMFAPGALLELGEAARGGGLIGFRKQLGRMLSDEAPTKASVSEMTDDDWSRIARLKSLTEAEEKTRLDGRTIKRHLTRRGIKVPWGRK